MKKSVKLGGKLKSSNTKKPSGKMNYSKKAGKSSK